MQYALLGAVCSLHPAKKRLLLMNYLQGESRSTEVAAAGAQAIAVWVSATTPGDSVYVINPCTRKAGKESIALNDMPEAVSSYLASSYNGYVFQKAYKIDSAGSTTGYVAIVQFNSNPVGLLFVASGTFVRVLEQREGRDLHRRQGW